MSVFIVIVVAITVSNCITVVKTYGWGMSGLNWQNGTHHPPSPNNSNRNSNDMSTERANRVMKCLTSVFKVDRVGFRTVIGCILVTSFLASSMQVLQTLQLHQAVDTFVLSKIQPNYPLPHDGNFIFTRRNSYVARTSETHQQISSRRGRVLLHEGDASATAAAAAGAAVRVFTQITFSAEYDRDLMSHTLQHYVDNGLNPEYMLITVHHGDPTAVEEVASAVHTLQQFGVKHIQTWYGNFTSQNNCDMRQQHRRDVGVTDCDWIVKVDADEFIRVPGNDMPRFLQVLGSQHFDSVFGN